jgi:hypothetical protein
MNSYLLPPVLRIRFGVASLQVRDDPIEGGHVLAPSPVAVAVGDVDPASVRPEEDDLFVLLGQLAPRLIQVYPVLLGERLQDAAVILRLRVGPRHYGAFVDAQIIVRHDQFRVYLQPAPEPVAAVARPVRAVEREGARLYLGDRGAAVGARERLREEHRLSHSSATVPLDRLDLHQALSEPQRCLHRVG